MIFILFATAFTTAFDFDRMTFVETPEKRQLLGGSLVGELPYIQHRADGLLQYQFRRGRDGFWKEHRKRRHDPPSHLLLRNCFFSTPHMYNEMFYDIQTR